MPEGLDERRVEAHREDQWETRTFAQFQRVGVSASHSGHHSVEWAPLIQKPIDWTTWLAKNWPRLIWRSQYTLASWLVHPATRWQACAGGLNLTLWLIVLTWLLPAAVRHVG